MSRRLLTLSSQSVAALVVALSGLLFFALQTRAGTFDLLHAGEDSAAEAVLTASKITLAPTAAGSAFFANYSISGKVYEDPNYSGGSGRSLSSGVGVTGATVELYSAAGTFITSTTTAADGSYTFASQPENTNYIVRVVLSTVRSSRTGWVAGLLPVQTWRYEASNVGPAAVTNEVGGQQPDVADSGAAPSLTWTFCANEGAGCSFTGTRLVRYGATGGYFVKVATGGISCTNGTFGDPTVGTVKSCHILDQHFHSASSVMLNSANVTGIDFGFNFDTVTNTNNSGAGSLRQVITNANTLTGDGSLAQASRTAGVENVVFMISNGTTGSGGSLSLTGGLRSGLNLFTTSAGSYNVATISPTSSLPTVSSTLVIDAQTQPGWTLEPIIEVSGASAGSANGFTLNAAGATLRGFIINRFGFEGVTSSSGAGIVIQGCWIGINAAGTTASANANSAIWINNSAGGHLIGGTTSAQRNVLSGNSAFEGVAFAGGSGIVIQGNYIGTNAAGTAAIPNGRYGVYFYPGVTGATVGGTTTAARNVISGNAVSGIRIEGSGITIQGNYIGLNAAGTTAVANQTQGVSVAGTTSSITIGGTTSNTANVISGNSQEGITFNGTSTSGSTIQGNLIGTNAAGTATIPNGTGNAISNAGIYIGNSGVTVGGTATGAGNLIRGNVGPGVWNFAGIGASVLGNSIYENGGLGIDISTRGATANDNAKTSGQANLLMDFPTITSASLAGGNLTVAGYIGTAPNQSVFANSRVEIFVSDSSSPRGQGQTYLGFLTSDASGNFSGTITGVSGITIGTTKLVAAATDTSSNTSEFGASYLLSLSIAGTIFEDSAYAGGAGRNRAAAGGTERGAATVELYDASGNFLGSTTSSTSGNVGAYSFTGLGNAVYTVRVVNSSVTSARSGYIAGLLPVQTFRVSSGSDDVNRVGGEDPTKADAAANSGSQTLNSLTTSTNTPQSLATVTLAGESASGVDFGFNFNTIVNNNGTGQGSLRQFIINANALSGADISIFMISDGIAHAGLRAGLPNQLTGGVAVITLASALPAVTGASTTLDATTQTNNVGNTNSGSLGTGGSVGVDAVPLSTVARPEIMLNDGSANLGIGLDLQAAGATVRGFAIWGFGTAPNSDGSSNIRVGSAATSALIEQNVIGATATSFTEPGAARTNADNIRLITASGTTIRHNLIGFSSGKGIGVQNGSTGTIIESNEIRGNSIGNSVYDGIDFEDSATRSGSVIGNLIADNEGVGIDMHASGGGNTVTNNTVTNNGIGGTGETPGIRVYGVASQISRNVINANFGAGILGFHSASQNVFSQNSIFANGTITSRYGHSASGQIGIDLTNSGDQHQRGTAPFYTPNDNGDSDAGSNGLINFPVIESVKIANGNLVAKGFAPPGATVEFFISDGDPSGFGEGQTYLFTAAEGSGGDADATTGSYSSPYGGLTVGSETTNRFTFSIPLPPNVTAGTVITATATKSSGGTSEFGNAAAVTTLGPIIELSKDVSPNGTQLPGTDLTYTIAFANNGGVGASSFILVDPDPANVSMRLNTNMDFKIGSVAASLGSTGLSVTVSYSNDNGATFAYVPVSGAGGAPAGYDATVTNIRWAFSGTLPSAAPNNSGTISFTARIR